MERSLLRGLLYLSSARKTLPLVSQLQLPDLGKAEKGVLSVCLIDLDSAWKLYEESFSTLDYKHRRDLLWKTIYLFRFFHGRRVAKRSYE
jgi:hypothetical protein